jgi:SWI/SNF-related matrix-associated actin-dependent regulator of chromatin subfamily A-like protein 1
VPTPLPTQLSGYPWLSARKHALLADEPRVGKTGTAIMALDDCMDETVCVVTTASGRAVWRRAFKVWSPWNRPNTRIVGWGELRNPSVRASLLKTTWDRVILDEAHYGKSFDAARTQAAYGVLTDDGYGLNTSAALIGRAKAVWCLTGTPIPHDPSDLYPMLRALFPERLLADPARGWPTNVLKYSDFLDRYVNWRPKKTPSGWGTIIVKMSGKNESELNSRLNGIMLLRTQTDAGIRKPIYETMPLEVSAKTLRQLEGDLNANDVLTAAKNGDTKSLDMHLGPLRRMTGEIKAHAIVEAVKEEFEGGLDKIVLAYWHKSVGQILKEGLATYGVVGIDGATSDRGREAAEQKFLHDPTTRVFLGQIEAAGEAIDLSSSAMLWFAETVFSPRSMKQMSLRVTNHTQKRQAIVRVCVLEGSIDEALQEILLRLWSTIREVLKTGE